MRTIPGNPDRLDKKSELLQRQYEQIRKSQFMPSIGRYNITISHEHKFIWFRVAKVGTRTILNHLKESGVCLDVEHASWLHYPVNLSGGYFKFAFVRNPWDRLASCWRDKIINNNHFQFGDYEYEKMKKFEDFVDFVSGLNIDKCDRHLRSQSALIDLNMVDYLGRMETFDNDASHIFKRLGLPQKEIERENVTTTKKKYQEYYSEHMAEKVSRIYQKDIQIFGYQF